jgi:hypothetical protein
VSKLLLRLLHIITNYLKIGAVFIDLGGLMLKFMQGIPCARLSTLMKNMLYFNQVYMGDKSSRWRRLNDGLPQGSFLTSFQHSRDEISGKNEVYCTHAGRN